MGNGGPEEVPESPNPVTLSRYWGIKEVEAPAALPALLSALLSTRALVPALNGEVTTSSRRKFTTAWTGLRPWKEWELRRVQLF